MDLKILSIKKAAIYIFKFRNINTILFHLFRGKDVIITLNITWTRVTDLLMIDLLL